MQRAIVIGCPGSGKSTFARKLHEKCGLPLYYLDMIWWKDDETTISKDEFDAKLQKILMRDAWIIDGNYNRTLEMRIDACDTVFFLDLPAEACVKGIKARVGTKREDMPWVEKTVDDEFLQFVLDFEKDSRPHILQLLEKYPQKNIVVFRSHEDANAYLESKKHGIERVNPTRKHKLKKKSFARKHRYQSS